MAEEPSTLASAHDPLSYYLRDDVKRALVSFAQDREVSARYGDDFGRRPDTLAYPQDVESLVKRGATSFHVSEEIWENPLAIITGMSKKELDGLRAGWDLILDVDCKLWNWSKRITHLLIEEIRAHGIRSVSCKFSGNKGFHIAVPWDAFLAGSTNGNVRMSDLFPELPRKILRYLVHDRLHGKLVEMIEKDETELAQLAKDLKISRQELFKTACRICGAGLTQEEEQTHCIYCHAPDVHIKDSVITCKRCGQFFENESVTQGGRRKYKRCTCGADVNKDENKKTTIQLQHILDVDAILIAPRHLYRMPYSLHEKSGLVSVPIAANEVLSFERERAIPGRTIVGEHPFLHYEQGDSARSLCDQALDAASFREVTQDDQEERARDLRIEELKATRPTEPTPPELFPPCMQLIRAGLRDGKKRALFCYINFLFNVGWSYDEIEKEVLAWNGRNPEPLRDNILRAHLLTYKRSSRRQEIMPPNCDNKAYYVDMGICQPDPLCKLIKNPVQYAKRKLRMMTKERQQEKNAPANNQEDAADERQKRIRTDFRTFDTGLRKAITFLEKNGRLPSADAKTKAEAESGAWIVRQHERRKEKTLPKKQEDTLIENGIF